MAVAFLDTNILIYAARPELERNDEHKRSIAIDLLANEDYVISAQVLAEFYHNTVRKGESRLSHDQAMAWIERLSEQPCAAIDPAIVSAGAAISERHRISYWDGAMIAAAEDLGATQFYSEDLNHGQRFGNVTVINPFLSAAH